MPAAGAPRAWSPIGRIRLQAIREIAEGKETLTVLARRYGVTQQSLSAFKKKHAEEIKRVQDNLHDQFSHLWAADKSKRIAAYQQDIENVEARQAERLKEALEAYEEAGEDADEKARRAEEVVKALKE